MNPVAPEFWAIQAEDLLSLLETAPRGLSQEEAERRLALHGPNTLRKKRRTHSLALFLGQFKSPIVLILLAAAVLSSFLRDRTDAAIILVIVFVSGILGFWQERKATRAMEKLLSLVQVKATVLRGGSETEIPLEDVVPGDIIVLKAGDIIPADSLILAAKDLFVDEATLTGETFPAEKSAGVVKAATPLGQRLNVLFMATHVVSGSGKAVVVRTGRQTEFGQISDRLKVRPPEAEFERGLRRFGYLLMEVTLVLLLVIFAVNALLGRPILESFLFALALGVGLTPQLLPAIVSVNLAHGARDMAQKKVIVKRLTSIENFGSMDVLCSDKTGTLTEGKVRVHSALDIEGSPSQKVMLYAYLNASFETGFLNPIDEALRSDQQIDISGFSKLDEVPYDFVRKRLSILVAHEGTNIMVTKGALESVLDACSWAETEDGRRVDLESSRARIQEQFETFSRKGYRVLGVAWRDMAAELHLTKASEQGLTFAGMIIFHDPAKEDCRVAIETLEDLGIRLKVITGDNRLVAASLGEKIGMPFRRILAGSEIRKMSDEALSRQAGTVDVFAEVEPNQKERIILALKKAGHVVGFMGDGINDAAALHAADVGISVDSAVDVAKEAADIVLLEKGLDVLAEGVREGRKTFANTLKYVFMATSANFGNMFSMAGASLALPFLPMLPTQILLTNLLTDFPEMTIATDRVDPEMLEQPRRWDIRFIRSFMMVFGVLSSVFDFLTFAVLLFLLHAREAPFRTGWFMESVVSASLIVLVVRTRRSSLKSRPGPYLVWATALVAVAALVLPLTPLGKILGFSTLRPGFYGWMGMIVILYVVIADLAKRAFYGGRGRMRTSSH